MTGRSDIEIARDAKMQPITDIGGKLGIPADALIHYGPHKAKISYGFIDSLKNRPDGKLVLVTAMTPTPAGEGKTKTAIGLGDGLRLIGRNAVTVLREPSMGPCFGMKGGATGGGRSQVVPMDDINLHFNGDFHAVTSAVNLLAAMIDNHIYWGNALKLDPRRIAWRRAVDMNDRSLRSIVNSLGGVTNGYPREDGFDITVATEAMAILCLAENLHDLERRLGNIIVGQTADKQYVTAKQLTASGAMSVLLRDALMPNLVQSLENNPVIIHGGPFANIAHGCNSVISTKTALKLCDIVVTEAGFGADLGAEKFFDIKCRNAGLQPAAAVIVASVRSLKHHAGVAKADYGKEDVAAVRAGLSNLKRHIENLKRFGVPVAVAINQFTTDTPAELHEIAAAAESLDCRAFPCTDWADGAKGAAELASHVARLCDAGTADFKPLYPDDIKLWDKVQTIARKIYGAEMVVAEASVHQRLSDFEAAGFGKFPVCMAKTQYSFSTDPQVKGAPSGHTVKVREVRLSAGAEFVVVIAGDILTMPGLPRVPAAHAIHLNDKGEIEGLF
jgi:formate--tetrahydrofolate ligase